MAWTHRRYSLRCTSFIFQNEESYHRGDSSMARHYHDPQYRDIDGCSNCSDGGADDYSYGDADDYNGG